MALITLSNGQQAWTDYNTAAKIWQILENKTVDKDDPEYPRLVKIAEQTKHIDFNKIKEKKK